MPSCPSFGGNGVPQLIEGQIDKLFNYGHSAYQTAMDALHSIESAFNNNIAAAGWDWPPVTTTATTDYLDLPDFQRPTKPDDVALAFALPNDPANPPSFTEVEWTLSGEVPTFTANDPIMTLPSRPAGLAAIRPTDPEPVVIPTYPGDPAVTLPEVPTLHDLFLPNPPTVDVDAIVAEFRTLYNTRPEAPGIALNTDFLATLDQQYALVGNRASQFVAQCPALALVCPRLSELLSGESTGMPAAVEQGLRERAFAAEDQTAGQAERQALDDWLARGFTLPAGPLNAQIMVLRTQAWDKKTTLNRDIWLESAKLEIENLRFALQQGIALEGQYWDHFLKLYDLSRTIAAELFDVQYKVVSAALEVYKAELGAWQTYAEFFKTWLQAELSKLEVYKAELEARKLLSDLNRLDVEIYKAQLDGVMTRVNVYKTQVDAANSRLQGELAKIEVFKTKVQAYATEVGAYETEWKAYGQAVQGELGKVEIYKAVSQAFAARVDAYKTGVEAEKAKKGFDLDVQKLRFEAWMQEMEFFKTRLSAEVARIESETKVYAAKTGLFSAEVQSESAFSEVAAKEAGLRLQKLQIDAQVEMEQARLALQEALETSRIAVQAMGEIGRVSSQLAAGTLSALNMSASMSSSTGFSQSSGCSISYNIDASE